MHSANFLFTCFIINTMRINNNYAPNFGAKFLKNVYIKKAPSYIDTAAACVEIEPQNLGDINALEKISKYWTNAKFITNIYNAARAVRNDSKYYKNNRIYAITTQNSDYENLNCDNILGVVHISPFEDKSIHIERIEADPQIINSIDREYKGIGTAMLNFLKTIANKITCFPSKSVTVKNFYFKNDFIEYPPHSNLFIWIKQYF